MTDHRLLTPDELAAIRDYITWREPARDRRFLEATRPLLDHADAQDAELARLRDALAAVCEEATRTGDPHNLIHQCAFCGKVSQYVKDPRTIVHAPDCPVAAARALLDGGA